MTFDRLQGRDYGTGMEIRPVTGDDLTDLTRLFDSSGVLSGCWCMFFLLSGKEFGAGWGATNRARFAELAAATLEPMGLLAYRQGEPVGWCAAGPRARYGQPVDAYHWRRLPAIP